MAFRYLKYLENFGNTIVAESGSSFSLVAGEGEIFTDFAIPTIQPLYLYREDSGNVVPNTDENIESYLLSIGQFSEFVKTIYFTGYTATTQSHIDYISGQTSQKVNTLLFNAYTAFTATRLDTIESNILILSGLTSGLTGTYTDYDLFTGYTATTETRLNGIDADIDYVSGQTANKLDASTFTGYTATTETRLSGIESDVDYVSGVTDTKLATIVFTGYTATTETRLDGIDADIDYVSGQTAQKVSTANNGLNKIGTNVRLGGTLTGATTITAPNTGSRLTFGGFPTQYGSDVSADYNSRSLIDKGYYTGNTLQTSKQVLVYASGITNINVTTPVAIPFNRLIRNDVAFYTYTGGTKIRILTAGIYDVEYSVTLTNSNGTAHSVGANLVKNGVLVTETTSAASLAGQTGAGAVLTLPLTQLTFAVNDIIELRGFRLIPGGGNVTTVANATFLSIIKKY